ncbi:hypothetical protein [Burkholderia sp. Ac-20379]|uniref:hypothetical protein n=1 Tax=Burkholderia sp. Ac-20379 TaxID=2703900 RepID=UPI0019827055|nr:hypothetical protein [Burkholderia sp. Ac-20379]MBN3727265.1 hypothetical protein [Burkholderia sp. Ac-20379]
MTIETALLQLLEQFKNDQCTDQVKDHLRAQIKSASSDLTQNPRDETNGNRMFLNAMVALALGTAEQLYGAGDDTSFDPFPRFWSHPNSQIMPLIGDDGAVVIAIGTFAVSWEEVFYDICHESLHLLNPVTNVRSSNVKVSALEEGVAVKFAEQIYEKYISSYCDKIPTTSPIKAFHTQYFQAYSAAKMIPDTTLKEVRNVFVRFSKIDDPDKFKHLTRDYLSDMEAEILLAPFKYLR